MTWKSEIHCNYKVAFKKDRTQSFPVRRFHCPPVFFGVVF